VRLLRGRVVSGLGDFGQWIHQLREHYRNKTGLDLYPGTLNIELEKPYRIPPDAIRLEGQEYGGQVSVSLVPCHIADTQAFILRTDKNEAGTGHHPRTIIEVAAAVRLREKFDLSDGDEVEIVIDSSDPTAEP